MSYYRERSIFGADYGVPYTWCDDEKPEDVLAQLKGKAIKELIIDGDLYIKLETDEVFGFFHDQSCCESVNLVNQGEFSVGDIIGFATFNIFDLGEEVPEEIRRYDSTVISRLSFYTYQIENNWDGKDRVNFDTVKVVDFVWLGTSNGYYSDTIELKKFEEIK